MTEYEMADLAASKVFEIQGGISLFQTATSMLTDIVLQYMNILFAYIIAAYFIGANLGKRQVWILTTLYVLFQTWMIAVFVTRGYLSGLILEDLLELQGGSVASLAPSSAFRTIFAALLVAALFASLYFMWSVRHPKAE
jgi:hypothetical protein